MKIVEAVLKTAAEGEENLVASLKAAGADEKRIEAAVAQYRITKGFSDVITAEDAELVAKAAGTKKSKTKKDEEEEEEELEKSKKSASEPDLTKLDPDTRARVEAVFKSNNDLVAQVGQLTTTVKSLIDNGSRTEFVAKAEKEFTHVPGNAQEIGLLLKSAHDASPALGQGIEKLLGLVNGLVAKSSLLATAGTAGGAAPGGDAWTRIETLASQLTMKATSGADMTKEQKIDYVVTKTAEGRTLYREYLGQNPAQRAKHGF